MASSSSSPTAADRSAAVGRAQPVVLVAAREVDRTRRETRPQTIVLRLVAGLAAILVVVVLLAAGAAQQLAEREAVNDAATVTDVLAEAVIQPALTEALAEGDAGAAEAFDEVVRAQVLGDDIVRVKIWSPEGVVLYADEPQLIGREFDLDEAQLLALSDPATRAAVSDLSEEENEFESGGRLLEVYRPVWTPDGRQLLFEVYLPYAPVEERSAELWRGFAGVTTSSLLLFTALTAPIVWGLVARLRGAERRRVQLLEQAVDASDVERRRIAGTVHDGPVQDLVAASFATEAAAQAARERGEDDSAAHLQQVAADLRGNIRVLRSLLMDIYPASLSTAGLDHALTDLAATVRTRGVDLVVGVDASLEGLPEESEQLIYRVAQEALRNTVAHAAPCTGAIALHDSDGGLILDVSDDGPGFDPSVATRSPADGHLGTRVMLDLARQAGAELSLATAPGAGTRWRLRIPLGSKEPRE